MAPSVLELACIRYAEKYFSNGIDPLLSTGRLSWYVGSGVSRDKNFEQLWSDYGLRNYGIDYIKRGNFEEYQKLDCLKFWIDTLYDKKINFEKLYEDVLSYSIQIRKDYQKLHPKAYLTISDIEDLIPSYVDKNFGDYVNHLTFYSVLQDLHSDNCDRIINLIQNKGKFVYQTSIDEAMHTGVRFKTTNNKEFELLYNFNKKNLIIQRSLTIHSSFENIFEKSLLGTIWSTRNDSYLRIPSKKILHGIEELGGRIINQEITSNGLNFTKNTNFIFFKTNLDEKEIIAEFERTRVISTPLYFPSIDFFISLNNADRNRQKEDYKYLENLDKNSALNDGFAELRNLDEEFPGWRDGYEIF